MNQTTETHLQVLRHIEANPEITQRELAKELGISLGKTNYCVQALLQKGWVKATNFTSNRNKGAYRYLLTPSGIEAIRTIKSGRNTRFQLGITR